MRTFSLACYWVSLSAFTLACSPAKDGNADAYGGAAASTSTGGGAPGGSGGTAAGGVVSGNSGGSQSSGGSAGFASSSGGTNAGGVNSAGGNGNTIANGGTSGGAVNASGGGAGVSSGGAGVSGGAAGAGAGGVQATAGAKGLGACTLPTGANFADVQANYQKWKADLLTADGAGGFLRVRRPNSGTQVNSSNSEGIAYGMTIAVYMDDQSTFDNLWKYEQLHVSNGLMDWEIGPDGSRLGSGAATDGDEDMAFALVMADKKWGGRGSLSDTYLNYAKKQIGLIWELEVDHTRNDALMPGNQFAGAQVVNISYFAPAYYRIFGQVSGKTAEWNRVVKTSYDIIEATLNAANKNASNGLVPAWSTPAGVPMAPPGSGHPTHHQLDSCRTPFRIAQDYCWFNEPRALAYLEKINAFYSGIGADNIVDGYNLDGSVFSGASLHLAAFVGGAGVGAMATPQFSKLRDDSYAALAAWKTLVGGSIYYNESWSMLSLLMMTGRFLDLTAP